VCLTITQPNGCTNTQCHNINFEGDPNGGECNANFMMEPLEGTPYGVIFTAAPQPEGTTYAWFLGDEAVANTLTFDYTFAGAGNYAICLTITQPNGCTNTQCHNINFEGDPNGGECNANFMMEPLEGTPYGVIFTAAPQPEGTTYAWFLGDEAVANTLTFDYTFSGAGNYAICLTITQPNGCTNTQCHNINFEGDPNGGECNANFMMEPLEGTPYGVIFTAAPQPEGTTYAWFLDDEAVANTPTFDYTFAGAGNYAICLTITQPNGCTNTQCHNINFEGDPNGGECNANFGKQIMPDTPLTAQFNPTAQPEGTTYDWDFGDGTTSDQINPIHTFGSPNQTYQVCLTITQPNGCTNTQCHNINFEGNPNGGECNANFMMEPLEGTPYGVIFTAAPQPEGTTYAWFLDDEAVANTPTFNYTFAGAGNYAICLTITQPNGCTNTQCHNINFEGDPNGGECNANFGKQIMPDTPLTAQFNPTAQPEGTTYSWDFGDGTTSDQINPIHTFGSPNQTYQVCLTITQPNGCTNTQCHNINFEGDPNGGECNANFMMEPLEGTPYGVIFTAAPQPEGTTYAWFLDDEAVANTPTFNYTFAGAGNYPICLTITQPNGCTNTQCHNINFEGDPNGGECNANFMMEPLEGTPYGVIFTAAPQPEGTTYAWFLDDEAVANTPTFNYTFAGAGNYAICLTITQPNGCTNTQCHNINFEGDPNGGECNANFGKQIMPDTPLTAQFNPTAQPEGTIYAWDFGDGTTSDEINPIHTFGSPNQTYQVCLTITQPNGCTNTQCHNINFEGNPNGGECNANFNHTPVAMQPLARQFNNLSVGAAVVSWLWTFGDGGTANEPNPQHTFPANGMYQVCLTITNADASCTDTRCKEVYLGDMPPPPPTDGCHAFYHANHPEGNLLEWNFENASWGEDIVSWTWDFGDGTTAQGQNQTHTYEAIGNYQVCLTITNDSATCTNTYCHSIHIGDGEPPTELYNVGGKVTNADGSLAQYALVYLVRYNNIGGGMLLATDVQVIMPEDEGEYNFQHIPTGNYLVKAALMPLDANYANNLPTYYLSANHLERSRKHCTKRRLRTNRHTTNSWLKPWRTRICKWLNNRRCWTGRCPNCHRRFNRNANHRNRHARSLHLYQCRWHI
jgi:PKD repeat protein